jgi:tRNA(Ile2) C34 agmatinyltransferase TiaS
VLFIGLDDTDTLESRGTGHLARLIAADLAQEYPLVGVTRHQLLLDPRVPYTRKNSSAAVLLDADGLCDLAELAERVKGLMLANFTPGSDPGLCVADCVPSEVSAFGRRAKEEVVRQEQARALAEANGMLLFGLGGDEGGVIGALAAVGLAATGQDGRYIWVGRARELSGLQPVDAVLGSGIQAVQTIDGEPVTSGWVQSDKLRPARRGGCSVLVVECAGEHWTPLKLD